MRKMGKRFLTALAILAVTALPGRADFVVTIQSGADFVTFKQLAAGGAIVATTGGAGVVVSAPGTHVSGSGIDFIDAFTVKVGGYAVTGQASTNAPGSTVNGVPSGFINLSGLSLENTTGSATPLTLSITTTTIALGPGTTNFGGFSVPPGPGKAVFGDLLQIQELPLSAVKYTAIYHSYLDGGTGNNPPFGLDIGTTSIVDATTSQGGPLPTLTLVTLPALPLYTLSNNVVLTFGVGSPGATLSGDLAVSQVTSALPAPAGFVFTLAAFPVLAMGRWLQRRARNK